VETLQLEIITPKLSVMDAKDFFEEVFGVGDNIHVVSAAIVLL